MGKVGDSWEHWLSGEGKFKRITKGGLEAPREGVYGEGRVPTKGRKSRSTVLKVRENMAILEAVPRN